MLVVAVAVAGGWLGWESRPTEACGPDFPNQVLWNPDGFVLSAPAAELGRELAKGPVAAGKKLPVVAPVDPARATREAGLKDLEQALTASGMDKSQLRGRLAAWVVARERIERNEPLGTISPRLPLEFQTYLEGAAHYRANQPGQATERWKTLLRLPKKQRRWRSTWAAWMLAQQARRAGKADVAVKYYRQVRQYAAAGMQDTLGLAATSLGWEARVELDRKRPGKALVLYAKQAAAGDPTAAASLERVVPKVLMSPKAVERVARHPAGFHALAAWLAARSVSRSGPGSYSAGRKALLAAAAKSPVKHPETAKLLGWSAFRLGRVNEAAKWLEQAPPEAPVTVWLKAKVALHAGKVDAGLKLLRQAARALGETSWERGWSGYDAHSRWPYDSFKPAERALGEAGAVALSRKDYVQALDLFVRSGWWDDAAYVAERVMTTKGLRAYVDKHWPASAMGKGGKTTAADRIRPVLARRLMREGKVKLAMRYHAPAEAKLVKGYLKDQKAAKRGPKKKRAMALWRMAKVTRKWGMELLGTELEPDFTSLDGQFDGAGTADERVGLASKKPGLRFGPSAEELARAKSTRVSPNKRFHYRYLAAELGWKAAELLKDDTKLKASVLCQAGTWLKIRDPLAADRFYKHMVRANPTVDLAVAADSLRWFPFDCEAP